MDTNNFDITELHQKAKYDYSLSREPKHKAARERDFYIHDGLTAPSGGDFTSIYWYQELRQWDSAHIGTLNEIEMLKSESLLFEILAEADFSCEASLWDQDLSQQKMAFGRHGDSGMIANVGIVEGTKKDRFSLSVQLAAKTPAMLKMGIEIFKNVVASRLLPLEDEKLNVTCWHHANYARSENFSVDAPNWDEIKNNYPSDVSAVLDEFLGKIQSPNGLEGVSVWQGSPGTGKTTALRALAHAAKDFVTTHIILDPEKFLGSEVSYLVQVLEGAQRDNKNVLIILEDAGELVSADTRSHHPQAIGRLLNVADGIVGQGLRAHMLITTNEDIKSLDPALLRPGRCVSKINFRDFSSQEAKTWLTSHGKQVENVSRQSLAELYSHLGEKPVENTVQKTPLGFR